MTHKTKFLSFMTILVIALSSCSLDTSGSDSSSDVSSSSSEEIRTYTITWLNYDNSVLEVDEEVSQGTLPTYDGETPTRIGNAQYEYTFKEWTPEVVVATSDQTYTATYLENVKSYTITWKNHDGSTLEVDEDVSYGTIPTYDGITPSRVRDNQYTYAFSGWSPTIAQVTANSTYVAQFTASIRTFTVTWKNYDGTVLEVDEEVQRGVLPTYDSETPTKLSSQYYDYSFNGWSPTIDVVEDDQTYVAQFTETHNDSIFYYIEYTDYIKITGVKDKNVKELVVPLLIKNKPVTVIGGEAFAFCRSLTSITISDNVVLIDFYALYGCGSLTSIVIPDSVTSIGAYAFGGCCFTSINIPSAVTSIGEGAFFRCMALTSIDVDDNNSFFSSLDGVLYDKNQATLINYPTGRTKDEFIIPYSVNTLGIGAFYYCVSLTSITIPNSVTYIGISTFSYCASLTSITIPDSITSIGEQAFYSCTSLTSILIPDSITSIGEEAFYSCTSLTSILIPDSITYIGSGAFSNCWNLNYNEYDNAYYLGNESNPHLALIKAKNSSITDCTINSNTEVIANAAFAYCTSLTSITIPDSVTSIGEEGFSSCYSMTSVTIGNGVTSIGKKTFVDCTSLTLVVISNGITSIDSSAFSFCENIDYNEYDNAYYLGNESNPHLALIKAKNSSITDCTINSNTEVIANAAFAYCYSMTSVTIGNGVTSIGGGAFSNCTSLTLVVIPNGVTSIGGGAFSNCTSLTSINVDDNNSFFSSLDGVLYDKDQATLIQYPKGKRNGKFVIPNSVTSIGEETFLNCTFLTSIVIPNSVTSIGDYAFSGCTLLKSIIIPNSVIIIGVGAFYYTPLTIYAEASSKPSGWHEYWNSSNRPVVWGYTG